MCLRVIGGALLLACTVGVAAPAQAQTSSDGARPISSAKTATSDKPVHTVDGALAAYFSKRSDARAAKIFRDADIRYKRVLIAHLLPSEDALLVEVELARGATSLRYPIRLEDISEAKNGSNWRVDWAPDAVYARAIADATVHTRFAPARAGQPWSEIQRLAAFPVIVGADYFVTPFGRIEVEKAPQGAESPTGLNPPEQLAKHVQRWTGQILQDDPGSANLDLLLGEGVSWKRATQAMLPAAMAGLFRIYFVTMRDDALVGFSAVAPVFKEVVTGESTLVIGVTQASAPDDGPRQYGVRLRVGSRTLKASSSDASDENSDGKVDPATQCGPRSVFCAATGDEFRGRLDAHIKQLSRDGGPTHVMLAASAEVGAAAVLNFLATTRAVLNLPLGKIVVGYIGSQP